MFLTSLAPAPTKEFPMVLVTILAGRYVESSDFNYASLKDHFRAVNDGRIRVIGEGETSLPFRSQLQFEISRFTTR